jgi:hypothetical protein
MRQKLKKFMIITKLSHPPASPLPCFGTALPLDLEKLANASKAAATSPQSNWCSNPWENCPMPKPAQQANFPEDIGADHKCTIRLTAPESYRQAFLPNHKPNDPKVILADIQRWKLTAATSGQLTQGTWQRNYTQQGTQLQGYLKVRRQLAEE